MTIEEFNETRFSKGDQAHYKSTSYLISSVDFEEKLIGIIGYFTDMEGNDEITWLRCESILYVPRP